MMPLSSWFASMIPNPDGLEISITDGINFAPIIGYDATAYQISAYNGVLRDLTDNNLDDLGNSGDGFGPGDVTVAFQWSVTIGVGESMNFLSQFGSDTPLAPPTASLIPEPGTTLLMGLGLALLSARRRLAGEGPA